MFLIRTAFWLTLIILILPTNEQDQQKIIGTAGAAVRDLKTFCVRNPDVCEKSASLFETFTQKAQFGAKLVGDFVMEAANGDTTVASNAAPAARHSGLFGRRSQSSDAKDTLTTGDLQPNWQGPTNNSGI
ncbi:MAG: DUF5330 domain-containing protein [Methyloligellaceae bacterium]